mgnify:CR=1 FL=1
MMIRRRTEVARGDMERMGRQLIPPIFCEAKKKHRTLRHLGEMSRIWQRLYRG